MNELSIYAARAALPMIEIDDLAIDEKDPLEIIWEEPNGITTLPFQQEIIRLEMNVSGRITLGSGYPWALELQGRLCKENYQWKHIPTDMVVSDFIERPLVISREGFDIHKGMDIDRTDEVIHMV